MRTSNSTRSTRPSLGLLLAFFLLSTALTVSSAFLLTTAPSRSMAMRRSLRIHSNSNSNSHSNSNINAPMLPTALSAVTSKTDGSLGKPNNLLASTALVTLITLATPTLSTAYNPTDYASETVQDVLTALKSASGNVEQTFKVYEDINSIITEGKGVGGDINYKGVQLNRGYIADEDTSIYNPGLTLLTESEKERLVEAVIQARQNGVAAQSWNEEAELGFQFLREKLDPLHVTELRGYLQILPVLAAVVYLGVLAVQQNLRDLFPVAYFVGVGIVFGPAIGLILAGP